MSSDAPRRRVALVTGATRNVGRAIAIQLAREGTTVLVNGRDTTATDLVAGEIVDAGGRAHGWPGDVTDADEVGDLVRRAGAEVGPVTILVTCAVQRQEAPFLETSVEDWHECLRVTLDGAFHCAQAVIPMMRQEGWGRIVTLAGTAAQIGATGRPAVVAAKSGLIGLTKAIAREFAADGITANVISPSRLATDRSHLSEDGGSAARDAAAAAEVPSGRLGTIADVVAACSYLCSDAAGYVNGHVLDVNGGLHV